MSLFDDSPFQLIHSYKPILFVKGNFKKPWKKRTQLGSSVPSLFCHGMSTLGSPKVRWISRMFRPSVAASCPPPCAKCPETLSRSSLLPGWHSCGIRRGFWAQSAGATGFGGWKGTRKVGGEERSSLVLSGKLWKKVILICRNGIRRWYKILENDMENKRRWK